MNYCKCDVPIRQTNASRNPLPLSGDFTVVLPHLVLIWEVSRVHVGDAVLEVNKFRCGVDAVALGVRRVIDLDQYDSVPAISTALRAVCG